MVALADKLSMPLLSIPVEIAWVDLINPVMAELLNRQLVIFEKTKIRYAGYLYKKCWKGVDLSLLPGCFLG